MYINYSRCFFTDLIFTPSFLHLFHSFLVPLLSLFYCTFPGFSFFLLLLLYYCLLYTSSTFSSLSFLPVLLPPPSFSVGPRGVQTGPLPGSLFWQFSGDERLRGGVYHVWPPTGQWHWCRDDLRLQQAPPERRLPYSREWRGSLRQPGGHLGHPRWPQCQPRLQPSLTCSCHPRWHSVRGSVARSGLQGHHWVRFRQDRGRGWEWRSWAEGGICSEHLKRYTTVFLCFNDIHVHYLALCSRGPYHFQTPSRSLHLKQHHRQNIHDWIRMSVYPGRKLQKCTKYTVKKKNHCTKIRCEGVTPSSVRRRTMQFCSYEICMHLNQTLK